MAELNATRKKLIEVSLPLDAINSACDRENSIRQSHPGTIHLWWAKRPWVCCRAILFAQLVDDPCSWPEEFADQAAIDEERKRLFSILEELIQWDESSNPRVVNAARREIARSLARQRAAEGEGSAREEDVLSEGAGAATIDCYLAETAPPIHDPFAGRGSIPLEAQRLGLRAIATDLNPVAVLICKALIEIPAVFAGRSSVHPMTNPRANWRGAEGLAEDVEHYGEALREEALRRIGHLYPEAELPENDGGGSATVIAWLWARTVESPSPAFKGVHVPLVRSFVVATKKGKKTWVEPVFSADRRSYNFEIRSGTTGPEVEGTVTRQGGICLASGDPMPFAYIRQEAQAGRMDARLMAVVAEGNRRRVYLPATEENEALAASAKPLDVPDSELTGKAAVNVPLYGLTTHGDLFTRRQLVALETFCELIPEIRKNIVTDALSAGMGDEERLEMGGSGAEAYGDAVVTYLAMLIGNLADLNNSLARWKVDRECPVQLFARQAVPMVWDYPEANPFSRSAGSWLSSLRNMVGRLKQLAPLDSLPVARVYKDDALEPIAVGERVVVCTDPPYYDNIGYGDLSDFFYVWHRRSLSSVFPGLFKTVLVPKATELVATPFRHGGREAAEDFFRKGMSRAISAAAGRSESAIPTTIFYAFKQTEKKGDVTASTGWETFLDGILAAGLSIRGTWPLRTEPGSRVGAGTTNSLASSIAVSCRPRAEDAPSITRGDLRRLLRGELPTALRVLQEANIAPVDLAQAVIGPGMAIFSRHSKVVEADGSEMSVRSALQLINEVADEVRGEEEADLDRETLFAVTWFETHGFEPGRFGDAETLAKARNVSVSGVETAGLAKSGAGKTRLLARNELPSDWDPATDPTLTVWECTQHLIRALEGEGESSAATLLARIGPRAEAARSLAYRLYTHCERKGWAEEARTYNGLVLAWPELEKIVGQGGSPSGAEPQAELFE